MIQHYVSDFALDSGHNKDNGDTYLNKPFQHNVSGIS